MTSAHLLPNERSRRELHRSDVFAIIGIGCRFPGDANTPEQFWRLISSGTDAVTEMPSQRFDVDALFDADPREPGKIYTRWGGYVGHIDAFDAEFFGIAPREARRIDPQQRLLLEVAWEALEDGGQVIEDVAGSRTGVFVGISTHDYADIQALMYNRDQIDAHTNTGLASSIAANRISYAFDLRGPSLAVDTACSSSLTAVHLACQSLARGECDLALAGGVNVLLTHEGTVGFCKAGMLSPDGRCRAFDAEANGFVRSEGAGMIALKPLNRALADNDPIYAVIRGTAINQDGRTAGMSVPNGSAQEALLWQVLADAGITPSDVQYIEAHGTGTPVGDPIEAGAIGRVFSQRDPALMSCLIGSVKTNLGHLEAAAGMAGLIKTALALAHRQIPPSIHFAAPNPAIPMDELGLRVPTALEPWPDTPGPAIAGVNSFGFGGANAHVLLQEPPRIATAPAVQDGTSVEVLALSARSPEALRELAQQHATHMEENPSPALHDLAYTAAARRTHHDYRLAIVGRSHAEWVELLQSFEDGQGNPAVAIGRAATAREPKLAFVFPGTGPQWWGMGRQLLREEPLFHDVITACDRLLRPVAGWSLLDELTVDEEQSRIGEAWIVPVANYALQIALAALWRSWGIVPDAVVGHSAGEMAAAHIAGNLSLEDGLLVSFHRGRLLHRASGTGTMLAAGISAQEAGEMISAYGGSVSIGALNSPTSVTLSGESEALRRIAESLELEGRFARFLATQVPYHSRQMDPMRDELLAAFADIRPGTAAIPLVSEVTGTWAAYLPMDGEYWWRNIREPVLFAAAVDRLIDEGYQLFVEVSPHPTLSVSLRECLAHRGTSGTILPTLRRMEDERAIMLRSLATLYTSGRSVDWASVYQNGTCVPLPSYPWQRERHWFAGTESTNGRPQVRRPAGVDSGHPLLGERLRSARPIWEAGLDNLRLAYLHGHAVQGSTVYPAAAYIETMLAVAQAVSPHASPAVENLDLRKLLILGDDRAVDLQTLYDPRDASVEIHSALRGGDPTWTLNATSTAVPGEGANESSTVNIGSIKERCGTEVQVSEFYESVERMGFGYSGAFRGVSGLWKGENEAVGRIGWTVSGPADDSYSIHPALLDSALQVLLAAVSTGQTGGAPGSDLYLPVFVGQIQLHRRPGMQLWSHATVRQADDTTLVGDVRVIDDQGNLALSLTGVRCQSMLEDRPLPPKPVMDWLYELTWEARALDGRQHELQHATRAAEAVQPILNRLADDMHWSDYYRDVSPKLNAMAVHFIYVALEKLGWQMDLGAPTPTDAVMDDLGIAPQHRRYFTWLMSILRLPGPVDDLWTAAGPLDDRWTEDMPATAGLRPEVASEISPLLLAAAITHDHPVWGHAAQILLRSGNRLASLLRGDVDVREVLFAPEAQVAWKGFFIETCGFYNAIAAEAIATLAENRAGSTPLRILEVGAGTGGTTGYVLPKLSEIPTEYVFTDISPLFLSQAQDRFADHRELQYRVLDIESDPRDQGLAAESFDIVLANDVLHATRELQVSLGHVRQLLRPGGVLVMIEGTRKEPWLDVNFGGIDGWWRFADLDLRPSHAFLAEPTWHRMLQQCGFEGAVTLADAPRDGGTFGSVILAQAPYAIPIGGISTRPRVEAEKHWLIFADRSGVAPALAAAIRGRGDRCTLVLPGDEFRRAEDGVFEISPHTGADTDRLLQEMRAEVSALHGVIHLWNLDAPPLDTMNATELMTWERLGCGSVLDLLRALETTAEAQPEIWLITSGAQAVTGREMAVNPAQSPVWGLGRVLLNEQAGIICRMVDLGCDRASTEIEALVDELYGDAREEELALRGQERFVRRMERATHLSGESQTSKQLSPDDGAFRLEIAAPGALGTLGLYATEGLSPGPGRVAIRVMAAGLNFKDVLLGLDMLPSGAFTGEWAGRTFGIECAGVVVACGEGVDAFHPGDEVVAIAPAAMSSHVVARADLVVRKPQNLSFEEAASIPIAFLTAQCALIDVAHLAPGESVLIHSATGGVGLAAIQIARRVGARIFATAGATEKRALLTSLGLDHVMDSRSLAFIGEVRELTGGEGVDVILNSLIGDAIPQGIALLRPNGRFVEIGKREVYSSPPTLPDGRTYWYFDLLQSALERPGSGSSLLEDVVLQVSTGTLQLLPRTDFDLSQAEGAFRMMAQAKHVGKVVLSVREPTYLVLPRTDRQLSPDATYLIAGGLGGFGVAVAGWMARHGARNIVLMSRTGAPKENEAAFEELRSAVNVVVAQGDVSREEDVARVIATIHGTMPPLKGIMHAAMVLDDDMLVRLDNDRFGAVLAPKVAGAWNLHALTLTDDLDFFVLFSSLASVVGPPMQGNYAAANAFLDALAPYRRGLGLPALSVSWGAISRVGYVSRHDEVESHLNRLGFEGLLPEEAFDTLDRLLRRDAVHVVAARIDWTKWERWNHSAAAAKPFLALAETEGQRTEGAAAQPQETVPALLHSVGPDQRHAVLEEYLIRQVARVLVTDPQRIDPERSLTAMGFDSLMAVELMALLNHDLGVQLAVVKLLEGINSRDLAANLLVQIPFDDPGPTVLEPPVESQPRLPAYPLSFEQQRLWLLDQFEPGNPAYNMPAGARLSGPLDVSALQNCLDEIVRRHEVLRTSIETVDGEPIQVVLPPAPVALRVMDLRSTARSEREAEMHQLMRQEARKSFDLSRGPLLRATLVTLADDDHVVLLIAHHIVCDAWSRAVLLQELAVLYGAFSRGLPSPLPELASRYEEYVGWQQQRLLGKEGNPSAEAQLSYWKRQLSGAPVALRLPMAHSKSGGPTFQGGRSSVQLSRHLSDALRRLSQEEGVTLFMTLLAALQALLHRWTGEEDIIVGTPISTRGLAGAESLIGCFMNTLVMRTLLTGDPSFSELLRRVKEVALGAYEHQDVPFERLVEELHPPRDRHRTPFFQVMLVLYSRQMPDLTLPQLTLSPLEIDSGSPMFDLTWLIDTGDEFSIALDYAADLFEPETINRMLGHLQSLLEGIVANPGENISRLSLLPEPERRQVLHGWNHAEVPAQEQLCLHRLFEMQVERTPDAIAVDYEDGCLTYRELNMQADDLADHLCGLDVGPEDVVGLCAEPSPALVVGILGILKAGGAYLPLDPTYPQARLAFMLDDARVSVLVTEERLLDVLPAYRGRHVVLDGSRPPSSQRENHERTRTAEPENAAYLMYTSGSTGTPKGVVVEHAAICSQLRCRQDSFPLTDADAVLLRTPISFDPSVWEILGPLAAGARLVVPRSEGVRDGAYLVRLIGEKQVTVLQVVPSVLDALLDQPGIEGCTSLTRVFCGGEPLGPQLQKTFFLSLSAELHNLYGPTEAAIDAAYWTCRPEEERQIVPIGRPVPHAQIYILDAHLCPVPIQTQGELYIGGAGLARGYLGRPELTAERFIPDPFSDSPTSRLYRTGDLARWLPEGTIELLGRLDQQVKIRGFRVEPGEIESVLILHPAIKEVAVVAQGERVNERHLVAFVAIEGRRPREHELRGLVKERLPDHMQPSAFEFVNALPRLASGKIDRETLMHRKPKPGETTVSYLAARDAVELELVQIWEDLLDHRPIGVTDDFFELGGHSLLAMRLTARVACILGKALPPSTLLEDATIEHLARVIRDGEAPGTAFPTMTGAGGSSPPFICIHPTGGGVFCYVDLSREMGGHPFLALQAQGLEGDEKPLDMIEEMADQHLRSLRQIQPTGPYDLGGWSLGGLIAFEMARRLEAAGEDVGTLALFDSRLDAALGTGISDEWPALLEAYLQDLGLSLADLTASIPTFWELDRDRQLACLLTQMRDGGPLMSPADLDRLQRHLGIFSAHLRAVERYVPDPYGGHIVLFAASEPFRQADAASTRRWAALARGGVEVVEVPGNHYTMLRPPHVETLARSLKACLDDAASRGPRGKPGQPHGGVRVR